MKIGIDLDDVLSESTAALIEFHNNTYGTNYKMSDLKNYVWEVWSDTLNKSIEKIEKFNRTAYLKNIKPIPRVRKILEKIKKNNELYIITGRADDITKETEEWVKKYYPNIFSKIFFTNQFSLDAISTTKKIMCNNLDLDILVEDNLENAIECSAPNRKIYLLDYPWNQTEKLPEGIKRVNSWKEIGENIL
jgi:5'(3')-deoxyribonucleotidase